MKSTIAVAVLMLHATCVSAFDLTVVSYNVESDRDTNRESVARDMGRIPVSHIWGLAEVDSQDLEFYRAAIGNDYELIAGNTGIYNNRPDDRLAIVFDTNVLELIDEFEELAAAGGSRHPLLARFRIVSTGQEFWFVVNHLQRGLGAPTNEMRQAQASWLKQWVQGRVDNVRVPAIILVGDYNFDVNPYTKRGNPAFDIFMHNGMFRWVEPGCLADDSCPITGTGCHPHFNSILDFVFLAGTARTWNATSEILFEDETNYCADESGEYGGSDHRPVRAVLTL